MAEKNSISNDELKSLLLRLDTDISGLYSNVTGSSENILSEVKKGNELKTELSLPDASSSSTHDDSGGGGKDKPMAQKLVSQGVAISYQIKDVFKSVKGSNRSLTYELNSVNERNGQLQTKLDSKRSCIRKLEDEVSVAQEESRKLQNELHHYTENNQTLQQQIRK
ncbi:unnamed protein product [Mytilus edulis]|uniref:Uncharacterized protein n=1 Tax=Mytilus edulis TaxID=6550 RepID=A0A8S3S8U0_MYTED|nr:unnamed protein product [Mytilus edulis]